MPSRFSRELRIETHDLDDPREDPYGNYMRRALTIEYGDEILASLGLSPDQFSKEAGFLLAAKLYELGKLTSGQAAQLCDLGRVEFLYALARAGVPACNLRPEDLDSELAFARNA